MPRHRIHPDIVGLAELAARLGVSPGSLKVRKHRGQLPPPRWTLGSGPVWCWECDFPQHNQDQPADPGSNANQRNAPSTARPETQADVD